MESVLATALVTLLLIAAIADLRSSRIPNWLTFPAMSFALAGHAYLGGLDGAFFSLAGLGTSLGLFIVIYLVGGIGAGDVKLMVAIGAFTGLYGVLSCAWLAIVVGGVYAIAAMCYQWGIAATGQRLAYAARGAVLTGGTAWTRELQLPFKLRYGLAIASGTLLFLLGLSPFEG